MIDKKIEIKNELNYSRIIKELGQNQNKGEFSIKINDETYKINNPERDYYQYEMELANQLYNSTRACDTDVYDISKFVNYKADNLKTIKDHVFVNDHIVDSYAFLGKPIEIKQFNRNLQQALAWKRLEQNVYSKDDVTWIKHEFTESVFESRYKSGYSASHKYAQSKFDGAPWEND